MLAGVLLHMVEAARPVDATLDASLGHRPVQYVNDAVFLFLNIDNVRITQFAKIIRRPAGGRIQQGLIQDGDPTRTEAGVLGFSQRHAAQHLRSEIILKGIVVVEAASGHRAILAQGQIALFSPHNREELRFQAKRRDKLEQWLSGSSHWILTVRCSTAAGVCPTPIAKPFREPPGAESRWPW